tara:strand:- start:573 stop:806 length:234 start_codon:yes stop_codon:yes gene_type:complete
LENNISINKNKMTELEELEDIVGSLENIEPFGMEPDFSSLGLEPADVLGFQTEEELDNAIRLLSMDIKYSNFVLMDV